MGYSLGKVAFLSCNIKLKNKLSPGFQIFLSAYIKPLTSPLICSPEISNRLKFKASSSFNLKYPLFLPEWATTTAGFSFFRLIFAMPSWSVFCWDIRSLASL